MKRSALALAFLLSASALGTSAAHAAAANAALPFQANQITAANVPGNNPVATRMIVRTPPANPNAHTAIVIMHAFGNNANNGVCTSMAQRGFTTLCIDHIYSGRQMEYGGYEDHVPALRAAINHLRNDVPGVTRVVLFGHSMGGPLMAFYANIAENGSRTCQLPARLIPCNPANLLDPGTTRVSLPAIDGIILSDTHPGDAFATFSYVDPAITDPATPGIRNPAVDMFATANGYPGDAQAAAPNYKDATYSPAFVNAFFDAQAARNDQITKQAREMYLGVRAKDSRYYPDDMIISVPGAEGAARLLQADLDIWKCTKRAHIFLTRDGRKEMSPGPICSVRPPSASLEDANSVNTVVTMPVKEWLGARALRTNGPFRMTINDVTGVDWDSSNTSTITNMKGVTKPLLMVAHGAHYFLVPDEMIFDAAKSTDKTFFVTEGAVHGGGPCRPCAEMQGLPADHYGDTQTRTHDYIAQWLAAKF
jgi:pimeloyl-ACP methyl ester carboxylesterase